MRVKAALLGSKDGSRKRTVAVTAIVVAGLVGSSIGVYRSVRGSTETSEWVTHTYQVINTLDRLLGLIVDAETGQRGYLLSQRTEFRPAIRPRFQ